MAAANPSGTATLGQLIIPIAFLVIFYFFAIRPQKKREKQIREMRESLKQGDKVVTIGGVYGEIVKLKEDTVIIEVEPNKTRLEMTRWAIGTVTNSDTTSEEE
ncbi:MAG: preprotein translocase subunit YajC [Tissierellia bacterium]|nr:preprotein translocase subunit YajC [Tissierellia bacterium]